MILPDLVESDEEYDSESETEQSYTEDAKHENHAVMRETYDTLKREKHNIFQPSGRERFCMETIEADYKDNEYDCYHDEASNEIPERNYEEETKETPTVDLHGKRAVESHKTAFPEATVSEDGVSHESETVQRGPDEVTQNIVRPLGKDTSCMRKMKEEKINARNNDENVMFSSDRKPRDAIEGDFIRFLYTNPSNNSTSWMQGRLTSRLDKLDDELNSEWAMNRFRINDIRAVNYWSNPEPPPNSAIVNINYSTTSVLGIHNDQLGDKENQKLSIGICTLFSPLH